MEVRKLEEIDEGSMIEGWAVMSNSSLDHCVECLLHFLSTFQAGGTFIHFGVAVLTAIMAGALSTSHKAHSDPPIFSANITVFFSFGFGHDDSSFGNLLSAITTWG
jgi:hypothetical protein